MKKFYFKVIRHRKKILALFFLLVIVAAIAFPMVSVNYDLNDYLPEDAASTIGLDVMKEEFDGDIPNARVMMRDVTIAEALAYKEQLKAIDGVEEVTWLDDAVNIKQPLQMQDTETVETYYKDGNALFSITIDEETNLETVSELQNFIREEDALTGSAVSSAVATVSTVKEIKMIAVIAVIAILIILALTTTSWLEPFVILLGLGVAIILNAGSNLIFGEISFVTNAAGNILQLAVSLDYFVFLVHRFNECRKTKEPAEAMLEALCKSTSSIFSSGATTVIGFLALVLMRFRIGADLGLALGKGIAISLIMVFVFMPGLLLSTYKITDLAGHRPLLPQFRGLGKVVCKVMGPVAILLILIMVPSYLASTSNSYYYGSAYIFGEDTKLGADTKAIEEVFGKSDSYVLLVPKGNLEAEEALVGELKDRKEISSVIAYVEQAGAVIPYEYVDDSILKQLESEHYSRIVLSIKADTDGEETFALVQQIRKVAQSYYGDDYYMAGAGVSTCDLMTTVTSDMIKVNAIAVGAVFLVLVLSMRSLKLPIILVLTIETAIWFNLSLPYYTDTTLFCIAYLIISSIQLGATVDYAILFTDRYQENRRQLARKESIMETVSQVTSSILTSAMALTIVGFLLGKISTHGLLSQLGYLLGKGTLCSLAAVFFALPGFLYLLDGITSRKKKEEKQNTSDQRRRNRQAAGKQTIAMVLAFTLLASSSVAPVAAASKQAEETTNTEQPSSKEEVVYAILNEDGTVNGIYVVNSFTDKNIIDYGTYQSVKNMNTTDEIVTQDDKISIQTNADKFYYQGDLETTDIPWNIAISYRLDGEEMAASQLAGKSGALGINIHITQNKNCDESFFKGHALQATITLDSENCKNIQAEDATIANVGKDKQITYTILPGKETDLEITADVSNFEMDAITINATKLGMNLEIDDSELTEEIKKLQDAVVEVKDGAGDLDGGAQKLDEGIEAVWNGLSALNKQSKTLTKGSDQIADAIATIQESLQEVSLQNKQLKQLASASTQIKNGINSLASGLDTMDNSITTYQNRLTNAGLSDINTYIAQHNEVLKNISISKTQSVLYESYQSGGDKAVMQKLAELVQANDSEAVSLYKQYIAAGQDSLVITNYIKNAGTAIAMKKLIESDIAYIQGSSQLINGIDSALDSKSGELAIGAQTLKSSYQEFDKNIQSMVTSLTELSKGINKLKKGVNTLNTNAKKWNKGVKAYTDAVAEITKGYKSIYEGSKDLTAGTADLYEGTKEFYDETSGMDTEVSDKIDNQITEMTGSDVETVSFVSEKNTNVESVLFVIKTPEIKIADEEEEVVEEVKTGIWEKIKGLFKKH